MTKQEFLQNLRNSTDSNSSEYAKTFEEARVKTFSFADKIKKQFNELLSDDFSPEIQEAIQTFSLDGVVVPVSCSFYPSKSYSLRFSKPEISLIDASRVPPATFFSTRRILCSYLPALREEIENPKTTVSRLTEIYDTLKNYQTFYEAIKEILPLLYDTLNSALVKNKKYELEHLQQIISDIQDHEEVLQPNRRGF